MIHSCPTRLSSDLRSIEWRLSQVIKGPSRYRTAVFKIMNMRHLSLIALPAFMLMLSSGTCQRTENTTKSMKIYKDSTVVEYFRRTDGWVAGDGAFSIPLSDGRTLWVMGDSHINRQEENTSEL